MALFARLYHFAGLVGSHEATVSSDVCRQPSLHTLTRRGNAPAPMTTNGFRTWAGTLLA
jgi:hypothetical protein